MRNQTAVTAYWEGKQLLLFVFACEHSGTALHVYSEHAHVASQIYPRSVPHPAL